MPRRRVDRQAIDQGDWNVCIAWRRMLVGCLNVGRDIRLPIAAFLCEARVVVHESLFATRYEARRELVRAWCALRDEREWEAAYRGIEAVALAAGRRGLDAHAEAGKALCKLLRRTYPKAPKGFERVGRIIEGRPPLIRVDPQDYDDEEDEGDEAE